MASLNNASKLNVGLTIGSNIASNAVPSTNSVNLKESNIASNAVPSTDSDDFHTVSNIASNTVPSHDLLNQNHELQNLELSEEEIQTGSNNIDVPPNLLIKRELSTNKKEDFGCSKWNSNDSAWLLWLLVIVIIGYLLYERYGKKKFYNF